MQRLNESAPARMLGHDDTYKRYRQTPTPPNTLPLELRRRWARYTSTPVNGQPYRVDFNGCLYLSIHTCRWAGTLLSGGVSRILSGMYMYTWAV